MKPFDYIAFWITCGNVVNMAAECYFACTDEPEIVRHPDEDQWMYITDFLTLAKQEDDRADNLIDMFVEGLQFILEEEGARSRLREAEEHSGLMCKDF
jgi:hypothetical protein